MPADAGPASTGHFGWLARVLPDVVLTTVFVGSAAVLLQILSPRADRQDWLFVVLMGAPLLLRRARPRTSAALVAVAAFAQILVGAPIGFHDAAVLVSLAALGGRTSRRAGLVGLGVGLVLVGSGATRGWWIYLDRRLGPALSLAHVLSTLGAVALMVSAWAYGEQARAARNGERALRARAEELERSRQQQAELAVAAERARIAREMHDVVAHGLTLMVVQADGARFALPPDADVSRAALAEVSKAGRSALSEMRLLLGLLRADGSDPSPEAPAPGLARLDDLLAQARSAGAEVLLNTRGDLSTLSDVTSLTAYRVVQEALTNARRHGGSLVSVDVEVVGGELSLRVQDSGGRMPSPISATSGLGLVGLQERVVASGGRTRIGPVSGGGFAVQAWLPLDPSLAGRGGV